MPEKEEYEKVRTHYSNERTLLSYIRTAMSVMVLAVALLRFFENKGVIYAGWGALIGGLFILFLGIWRFWQERERIKNQDI